MEKTLIWDEAKRKANLVKHGLDFRNANEVLASRYRPATTEELQAGVAAHRKRGRPAGSATKEQVAIRFDHDVLAAFRTTGPGWQTRMNDALKDWLKTHSAA